jgi:tRNA-2-methylthio-N6-dimethylallyladenosine synthase
VYLNKNGIAEVTLLGQNVNAYGKDLADGTTFPTLLRALNKIKNLKRIRFTTSHPRDAVTEMIQAIADSEKVCEHIHLPLQSGSNSVLKAMRRGYTFESYDRTVTQLRKTVPGIAITSDIIVGFPGETETDFKATCRALENIRFDQIFSFKYSIRPGTAAASLKDHISEEQKAERLSIVHEIQGRITESYHKASEGTLQSVLIEGFRPSDGQPFGRTRTNKIVNLESSDTTNPGKEIIVTITKGLRHSLKGIVT